MSINDHPPTTLSQTEQRKFSDQLFVTVHHHTTFYFNVYQLWNHKLFTIYPFLTIQLIAENEMTTVIAAGAFLVGNKFCSNHAGNYWNSSSKARCHKIRKVKKTLLPLCFFSWISWRDWSLGVEDIVFNKSADQIKEKITILFCLRENIFFTLFTFTNVTNPIFICQSFSLLFELFATFLQ